MEPGIDRKDYDKILKELHTEEVAGRLAEGIVGIAGLGGLGSNAAVMLAMAGIGRIVMADFDTVEAGNLNRQFYFTDQIGLKKTEALRDILKKVNPFTDVEVFNLKITDKNAAEIFAGCFRSCLIGGLN